MPRIASDARILDEVTSVQIATVTKFRELLGAPDSATAFHGATQITLWNCDHIKAHFLAEMRPNFVNARQSAGGLALTCILEPFRIGIRADDSGGNRLPLGRRRRRRIAPHGNDQAVPQSILRRASFPTYHPRTCARLGIGSIGEALPLTRQGWAPAMPEVCLDGGK